MRRLILILTIVVATLPLSVVLGQQGRENTLIIAAEADATTFNPLFAIDGGSQDAGQYLWPIPFDIDPVSGLPLDGLTSWEISEDGLTYTFTIREDAVWSDDTPITSRDAQFTYEAAAADIVASPRQSQALSLGTINVIDDKSYQIVLDQVNCAVFGTLANLPWAPAHKFAPDFSDVADNPYNSFPDVSGGPWILEEWEPDDFQRYRANPTYWGGEPKIPTMIRRIMPETSVRIQSLAAGEADFTILSPDQFAQLITFGASLE